MRATLLALALATATPALASEADDALLDQTPMLESAKAAKTAAILAYPAVCNSTVPMQVLEAAALMARAHGGPFATGRAGEASGAGNRGRSRKVLPRDGGIHRGGGPAAEK